ncbi:MAG: hypothetical protein WAW96_16205 [Alphaproteobacteria bacterium]
MALPLLIEKAILKGTVEVEPGKVLFSARRRRKYLLSKEAYIAHMASSVMFATYVIAIIVCGYLHVGSTILSYLFFPVVPYAIVVDFKTFWGVQPLSPEEVAKYDAK